MGGRTITEPAREVDVIHETGVLVVGSGPSGLAAALAAARAGADVTLLERFGCFGGNLTAVGVEGLAWDRHERTIDAELQTLAGTWGAVHDSGELTYLNVVHLTGCDGTDPDSLTRFEIEGRRQAAAAIAAIRRYTPGCAGARLRNFGMTIGIRDTRKLDAVYNLTEDDVRGEGRFEDSIGIYPEFIDGYGVLVLPTTGRYMQIPYRSMLPRRVRRLLVAGRAIGGDRIAHAATRNMACCVVTGQAAGVAAAVSLAGGRELVELELTPVFAELERQGVRRL
jgi:FAD dependent oxidoreductase